MADLAAPRRLLVGARLLRPAQARRRQPQARHLQPQARHRPPQAPHLQPRAGRLPPVLLWLLFRRRQAGRSRPPLASPALRRLALREAGKEAVDAAAQASRTSVRRF